jgi:hypothetical protein
LRVIELNGGKEGEREGDWKGKEEGKKEELNVVRGWQGPATTNNTNSSESGKVVYCRRSMCISSQTTCCCRERKKNLFLAHCTGGAGLGPEEEGAEAGVPHEVKKSSIFLFLNLPYLLYLLCLLYLVYLLSLLYLLYLISSILLHVSSISSTCLAPARRHNMYTY